MMILLDFVNFFKKVLNHKGEFMGKLLLCFVLSANVFAATVEEAKGLFENRGQNADNAEIAANMFKDLATKAASAVEKGILKTKEAQATYYVGGLQTSDAKKKEVYGRGMEAAKEAFTTLDASAEASKTDKATAHYFYAINLGKWAEANGVLASLGRWPELKEQLDIIDSLDKSVDDYGSLRTRARALHKLPFGDKGESEKLLAEASLKTYNEAFGLGNNTTANNYYLDILAKNRNSQKFCELYNATNALLELSDEELKELNPAKLPESKGDLKNFKENKGFEEDVKKFADRNC